MTDEKGTAEAEVLILDGQEVRVTHPDKLYFSRELRLTKLDLVRYYLTVGPGALQGILGRPIVLKRFVNGAEGEPFYQKRAPSDRPAWLRTVTLSFPSGRTAEELVVDNAAGLAWIVNLGCLELHPHPVRSSDLDHPDELRIDLDPGPGVSWSDVRRVALEAQAVLADSGLIGWPKTSGSRGIHILVRLHPRWSFTEVRRAALALARAVERLVPALATSKWWKEERHGVFLDYNQNAKDRTTCSAYSVRPLPDARVSTPLRWDEVESADPADFTVLTVPARFAVIGDPHAAMDAHPGSLDALLALAARDEASGLGDAPWPPHFRKMEGEGARVQPSRARAATPRRTVAKKSSAKEAPDDSSAPGADTLLAAAAPNAQQPPPDMPADLGASLDKARARTHQTTGRRRLTMPLITVANSRHKSEALAGLERWKSRHPEAAALLAPDDILIDSMRGASTTWTRIRINLRHIPEPDRPPQETPDPDDDPTRKWREGKSEAPEQ